MKDRSGLYLKPLTPHPSKKRLKVLALEEVQLTRPSRHSKIVSPNADIVGVLLDLTGARLDIVGGDYGVLIKDFPKAGNCASLFGLFRALAVLKAKDPDAYQMVISLAKLLSYHVDENIKVPPLVLPKYLTSTPLEGVWKEAKKFGVSYEDFVRGIYETLENKLADKDGRQVRVIDEIALFSSNREEDRKELQKWLYGVKDSEENEDKVSIKFSLLGEDGE